MTTIETIMMIRPNKWKRVKASPNKIEPKKAVTTSWGVINMAAMDISMQPINLYQKYKLYSLVEQ